MGFICETIEPIRGFERWIETYLAIRERLRDIHFVVISKDRIKYGDLGKSEFNGVSSFKDWSLAQHSLDVKDMDDVTWLGMLPLNDYLSLLSELDIVIYPMYGMFANWSLFHALHMGAPVVASDRAYLPEVIVDGENGFLADPDSPAELAVKAIEVLASRELRSRFKVNGRKTVETRYSLHEAGRRLATPIADIGLEDAQFVSVIKSAAMPYTSCTRHRTAIYVVYDVVDLKGIQRLLGEVGEFTPNVPTLCFGDKTEEGISGSVFKDFPNVIYRRFPANTHSARALNILMQEHSAVLAVKIEPNTALIINPPTLGANRGGGNKTEQGLKGQISTGSSRYWAVL